MELPAPQPVAGVTVPSPAPAPAFRPADPPAPGPASEAGHGGSDRGSVNSHRDEATGLEVVTYMDPSGLVVDQIPAQSVLDVIGAIISKLRNSPANGHE